jgi:hypothetical protein
MAVNARLYGSAMVAMAMGALQWGGTLGAFKMILLDSGFAPNQDTGNFYTDQEITDHELPTAGGYTQGGVELTFPGTVLDYTALPDPGGVINFYANDVVFTNITADFRWAIIYQNYDNKQLFGWIKFSNTADVSAVAQDFTVEFTGGKVATLALDDSALS